MIPEIALVVYGLISSKYSLIFYGCLGLALLNVILNVIAKKIAIKEIKNNLSHMVSTQTQKQEKSDEDIINL